MYSSKSKWAQSFLLLHINIMYTKQSIIYKKGIKTVDSVAITLRMPMPIQPRSHLDPATTKKNNGVSTK